MNTFISPQGIACRNMRPPVIHRFSVTRQKLIELGIKAAAEERYTLVVTTALQNGYFLYELNEDGLLKRVGKDYWEYKNFWELPRTEVHEFLNELFGPIPWDEKIAHII